MILAVETSCDDTCAAVVTQSGEIRSSVISSQTVHDRYGGVVPEVASRHHLELIDAVIGDAIRQAEITLDQLELVAATRGPGLVGALLVGLQSAKALAAARKLPFVSVDHLQGHVAASFIGPHQLELPFVILVASGGHTLLAKVSDHSGFELLGETLDDAAGEAFDKGARLLGLGYPGGPALQQLAQDGDPSAFDFPVSVTATELDFSFSGLKTALLYKTRELGEAETQRLATDLAASYQHTIVETLVVRIERALQQTGLDRLALGGGVAANALLRSRAVELADQVSVPPLELCTDNAAMIASAARYLKPLLYPEYLALDVYATGERP